MSLTTLFNSLTEPTEGEGKTQTKAKTRIWLAEVAKEVEQEVGGKVVSEEEVALKKERSLSNLAAAAGAAAGVGAAGSSKAKI